MDASYAQYFDLVLRPLIETIGIPALFAALWKGISVLQQHGYRTAYAQALLRAAGAGQTAAAKAGLSVFAPEGRALAVQAGTAYLMATVGTAGKGLGIKTEGDHALRVEAQLGALELTAVTSGTAPAVANDSGPPVQTILEAFARPREAA